MPSAAFRCPKCQTRLEVRDAPSKGKVKCRECGATVNLGTAPAKAGSDEEAISTAEPRLAKRLPEPGRRPRSRDEWDEEPVRSRRPSHGREQDKGLSGLAIAALCGGGVVLLGVIVLVVVLSFNKEPDGGAAEGNGNPLFADQPADAGGGLSLATLAALKRSTVFIKVDAGDQFATGSGFLARVEGDTAFIVTNYHVITPPPARFTPFPRRFGPRLGGAGGRQRLVFTLVFASGTKEEQSHSAEVAAADKENDLAILRVRGLHNGPTPVAIDADIKLVETMPVFILGFPFGEALALDRGNPAITVGKGSVSSIRLDQQGRVGLVQINGDLNPGNSGGPVVDSRGRLVGIAVATVKGTQIGLAIPVAKLPDLLAGAPARGPALQPQPDNLAPLFPGQPSKPGVPQPPPQLAAQPLAEPELAQNLQEAGSGNPALVNNALLRLSKAKPLDAQRARVIKTVEPLVAKEEFAIGMYALKVLAVWGTKDNVPTAVRALASSNALIRLEAIRTLGKFKDARAAEPLAQRLTVLQDRATASQALKELGPAAEKAVQPLVRHADLFVRHDACKILEVIGTEKSVVLLTQACQDENGLVRLAAESALAAVQARKK